MYRNLKVLSACIDGINDIDETMKKLAADDSAVFVFAKRGNVELILRHVFFERGRSRLCACVFRDGAAVTGSRVIFDGDLTPFDVRLLAEKFEAAAKG